jgi:hypothetical protein
MAQIRAVILTMAMAVSLIAVGQEPYKKLADQPANNKNAKNADLERELWDADQQWLCSAGATPYHKDYKECIEVRSHYSSRQILATRSCLGVTEPIWPASWLPFY